MADRKENELPIVDSVDYLRGLLNGDSGLVALDTILVGVMKQRGNVVNLDSTIETGVYGINKDGITNNPPVSYGILLVLFPGYGTAGGGEPVTQIAIDESGSNLKIRTRWSGKWSVWKSITVT